MHLQAATCRRRSRSRPRQDLFQSGLCPIIRQVMEAPAWSIVGPLRASTCVCTSVTYHRQNKGLQLGLPWLSCALRAMGFQIPDRRTCCRRNPFRDAQYRDAGRHERLRRERGQVSLRGGAGASSAAICRDGCHELRQRLLSRPVRIHGWACVRAQLWRRDGVCMGPSVLGTCS